MNSIFSDENVVITNIVSVTRAVTPVGKFSYLTRPYHNVGFKVTGNGVTVAQGKTFDTAENMVIFKPQGVADVCDVHSPADSIMINFEVLEKKDYLFEAVLPVAPSTVLSKFLQIEQVWFEKKRNYKIKALSLLYEILNLLSQSEENSVQDNGMVDYALKYIDKHFCEPNVKISDIISLFNVSDTYFRKLFFQKVGVTPKKYLIDKRLARACDLLWADVYSVSEVARACGFESIYFFSRSFKQKFGTSPNSYIKGGYRKADE